MDNWLAFNTLLLAYCCLLHYANVQCAVCCVCVVSCVFGCGWESLLEVPLDSVCCVLRPLLRGF